MGVRIELDVPDAPVIAEVDPRRVERVLRNLVGNAVEHGEARPVLITLACADKAVAVTVRDHGVGLKPGEEKLVFNRFWRADPSRARQTGGTGLGLSISLEDARLHGGWLEAWGAPGQGAQFRLTLPARAGDRLTASPLRLVPADAAPPFGGPRARVSRPSSRRGAGGKRPEGRWPPPTSAAACVCVFAAALAGLLLAGAGCGIPNETDVQVDGPGPSVEAGSGRRSQPRSRRPGAAAGPTGDVRPELPRRRGRRDRPGVPAGQAVHRPGQPQPAPGEAGQRGRDQRGPAAGAGDRDHQRRRHHPGRRRVQQVGVLRANGMLAPPVATETEYVFRLGSLRDVDATSRACSCSTRRTCCCSATWRCASTTSPTRSTSGTPTDPRWCPTSATCR